MTPTAVTEPTRTRHIMTSKMTGAAVKQIDFLTKQVEQIIRGNITGPLTGVGDLFETAQEILQQLVLEVEEYTNGFAKPIASYLDSGKNEELLQMAITLYNKARNINNASLTSFKTLIRIISTSLMYLKGITIALNHSLMLHSLTCIVTLRK